MSLINTNEIAQEGDLVQLLGSGYKSHFLVLKKGEIFQTHRGVIKHDDIIDQPWGIRLSSHQGNPFYLLQPSLSDLITNLKRNTQIMYAKDIGQVLITMGIGPGQRILEAGTGSGALTTVLAYLVGSEGQVISYDRNADAQKIAIQNLSKFGLESRVIFKQGDISEGVAEANLDAIFLDIPNPYDVLQQMKLGLKPGGFIGTIIPTFNQAEKVLYQLKIAKFAFIEMVEVLVRYYKINWQRLRPTDRMVAHTGYLIFARSVFELDDDLNGEEQDLQID